MGTILDVPECKREQIRRGLERNRPKLYISQADAKMRQQASALIEGISQETVEAYRSGARRLCWWLLREQLRKIRRRLDQDALVERT